MSHSCRIRGLWNSSEYSNKSDTNSQPVYPTPVGTNHRQRPA